MSERASEWQRDPRVRFWHDAALITDGADAGHGSVGSWHTKQALERVQEFSQNTRSGGGGGGDGGSE